jgi:hypothetical protein
MKATWMAGVLAAAGMLAAPARLQAAPGVGIGILIGGDHDRRDGYGQSYDYGRDAYRIGYDRGFEEGIKHGAKDGHKGESYNFWHDKRYRNGDSGYKGYYGPKHEYVAGYRRGYEAAYRRAYVETRHRHYGRQGYCYERHDDRDYYRDRDGYYRDRDGYYRDRDGDDRDRDRDRIIYERPRW